MDLLSAHHYTQRRFRVPFTPEAAQAYEERFLEYSGLVAAGVRGLIDDLRERQDGSDPAVDRLRLSIDEWGIVREWEPEPDGPGVGIYEVYYTLGDGIANARALHELDSRRRSGRDRPVGTDGEHHRCDQDEPHACVDGARRSSPRALSRPRGR